MSLSERRVAQQEGLSSVAAEARAPVLSLEAPLAHSHPPDGVGEQDAMPGENASRPRGVKAARRLGGY